MSFSVKGQGVGEAACAFSYGFRLKRKSLNEASMRHKLYLGIANDTLRLGYFPVLARRWDKQAATILGPVTVRTSPVHGLHCDTLSGSPN